MPIYPSDEDQLIVTGFISYIFRIGIEELCKFKWKKYQGEKKHI